MSVKEATQILEALRLERSRTKLYRYEPYPYQAEFHHANINGKLASQRALMAANGVGKTICGAMEMAIHLTGIYPSWWKGHRFDSPIEAMIGAKTNDQAKMVIQKELFGDPIDDDKFGTGTIPYKLLGKITKKPGVPGAIQEALVRHVAGGWSRVTIMTYAQEEHAFMGTRFDVGWADEEPPSKIWSQFIRGTISRPNAILYTTFTPEEGVTEVVHQFMNDIRPSQVLIRADWDDAPHLGAEEKAQRLASLQPHERDMRSKGIPLMGRGMVFQISDDEISVDPFEIPDHFARICAIDFGYNHPFAAAWLAHDRDLDIVYLYDCYREAERTPPIHASAIKKRGDWIPIVWPHDGLQHDKGSGISLAEQYRSEGLPLLRERFTNPPPEGAKEGTGGNGVEAGIIDMLTRMETGRFKVFKTCRTWFEEKGLYHRNEQGVIVKVRDDVISASRYAAMSLRFAETKPKKKREQKVEMSWLG